MNGGGEVTHVGENKICLQNFNCIFSKEETKLKT
jgi:hypothetical protein